MRKKCINFRNTSGYRVSKLSSPYSARCHQPLKECRVRNRVFLALARLVSQIMFEKSLRRRPWKQLRGRVVDPIPVYPNTLPYSQSPKGKAVVEAKKAARKSGLMDSVFDTFVSRSGSHSSYGALSVIPTL